MDGRLRSTEAFHGRDSRSDGRRPRAARALVGDVRGVPAVRAEVRRLSHEVAARARHRVLQLLQVKGRNANTVHVAIMALRFLLGTTLQRPEVMASVRVVRTHSPQPDVPSGSQVAAILAHARNARDRAMFIASLRREVARLGDARARGGGHRQQAHGDPSARHQKSPRPHRPSAAHGTYLLLPHNSPRFEDLKLRTSETSSNRWRRRWTGREMSCGSHAA